MKDMAITIERTAEFVQKLMFLLRDNPEGIPSNEAIKKVAEAFTLDEFENGRTNSGRWRFSSTMGWASTTLRNVGWLIKDSFFLWFISEEGKKALEDFPDPIKFYRHAIRLDALKKKHSDSAKNYAEKLIPNTEQKPEAAELEEQETPREFYASAKADAYDFISEYLKKMDWREFQILVSYLVKAMGYHVFRVSPPGSDQGVDVWALNDPLGVTGKRIKVQVKRWDTKAGFPEMSQFNGVVKSDAGIFVCTGGFTEEALRYARTEGITTIDMQQFIDLWVEHSPKLKDTERDLFPLVPVYVLLPQE
jgi:restriction system protein